MAWHSLRRRQPSASRRSARGEPERNHPAPGPAHRWGLRKAAARRLAESGCTPHQIAAITGHKTLKEVERYTRAAAQKALAGAAMERVKGG
ncbi:tyrosine-type recombinase/integrase [Brevundimonas sp. KM4]|uniref:tyrosine-type recombinase/integrase n=1 Tax=Brevundimonas sp. KM4 TaxID=1628191 RepID=UPI0009E62C79